jgi:hypothetical protein
VVAEITVALVMTVALIIIDPKPAVADDSAPPATSDAGMVCFEVFEGLKDHKSWYDDQQPPDEPVVRWNADALYLHRLPYRYDRWGIRDSWKPTVMVRATWTANLPAGDHRVLVRSRGLSRMMVDDIVVAETKPISGSTDGHQPVLPLPDPPAPGMKAVGYGDQEAIGEFNRPSDGPASFVYEFLVGGSKFRADPGETLAALSIAGDQAWRLIDSRLLISPNLNSQNLNSPNLNSQILTSQTSDPAAVDDLTISVANLSAIAAQVENRLTAVDSDTRHRAAATNQAFWQRRRQAAEQWLSNNPPSYDASAVEAFDGNPIDYFIQRRIASESAHLSEPTVGDDFDPRVRTILRDRCFRCHGEKSRGGLRLDRREDFLTAGDSGVAAVVPGAPDQSLLLDRIDPASDEDPMPPDGPLTDDEIRALEDWIAGGAAWPAATKTPPVLAPIVDDATFLRRVSLDLTGLPPSETMFREFVASPSPQKRATVVDSLLRRSDFADHWVSYWQDVLAENPNPLKPSLNNSGPFRWYLYESLIDNHGWDRVVHDLVMMRGSEREGGSAGFGLAADNDAPMAAKAHIIASAFMGVEMKCARCHDSPYSSPTQHDLFALAAMLDRGATKVPKSSTVSPGFFDALKGRESLIRVTMKPGEEIQPAWPFADLTLPIAPLTIEDLVLDPEDSRQRLASLLTGPHNQRFAQVIVNRVWQRLMGAGIVEPVNDWDSVTPSHPELLEWLARDFTRSGYDLRYLSRQIVLSQAYQRAVVSDGDRGDAADNYFASQQRRRMTAEQIVDALFNVSETPFRIEELTFDQESRRPPTTMISLGRPTRSWMFATLSNERDRPSLSLPRAQAVVDVLEAFGWTASRQNPVQQRDPESNLLQPGILAGSTVTTWVTRASTENGLADLAINSESPEDLIESLFIRFFSRLPTDQELDQVMAVLGPGYDGRCLDPASVDWPPPPRPLPHVSWSNHLSEEANTIKLEMERRARAGAPADPRLRTDWRQAYEDVVWSMINSPEFIWIP